MPIANALFRMGLAVVLCAGCGAGLDMRGETARSGGSAIAVEGTVAPHQMHLEWQPERRGDRTRVAGYVYNDYILYAKNVVVVIESVDATGQVTGRVQTRLIRELPPGTRSYFEAPPTAPAAAYRVVVASVHWYSDDGPR